MGHWSDQPLPHKVRINKKTGAVSWEIGPDVLDYKVLLDTQANNRFEYAPKGAGPRWRTAAGDGFDGGAGDGGGVD